MQGVVKWVLRISMAVKDMPGSLADNTVLTGTINSSQFEPVFVGSDDCQVIEDGNEVDCLGIIVQ